MSEITSTFASDSAINESMDAVASSITTSYAIKIAGRAKNIAPVDMGRLRNSIMWRVYKKEGGLNDMGGEIHDKRLTFFPANQTEGYVGCNLAYSIYQEFGTRNMAPQPFLRPAVEMVKTDISATEIKAKIDEEHALGKLQSNQERTKWNI
jgi:HK97 gp10 family phage protein